MRLRNSAAGASTESALSARDDRPHQLYRGGPGFYQPPKPAGDCAQRQCSKHTRDSLGLVCHFWRDQ